MARAPEKREAQRRLAQEVTRLVHGADEVERAERGAALLFDKNVATFPVESILAIAADVPSSTVSAQQLAGEGLLLVDLLSSSGVTSSKGEAIRLIRGGGIYVNNQRVSDERLRLTRDQAVGGKLFLLRKGAKQNLLVRILS
jgi:tyrosyl-tRNA synthetase